jgi:hypothetical protein
VVVVSYELSIELLASPISHQIKKKNNETTRIYAVKKEYSAR